MFSVRIATASRVQAVVSRVWREARPAKPAKTLLGVARKCFHSSPRHQHVGASFLHEAVNRAEDLQVIIKAGNSVKDWHGLAHRAVQFADDLSNDELLRFITLTLLDSPDINYADIDTLSGLTPLLRVDFIRKRDFTVLELMEIGYAACLRAVLPHDTHVFIVDQFRPVNSLVIKDLSPVQLEQLAVVLLGRGSRSAGIRIKWKFKKMALEIEKQLAERMEQFSISGCVVVGQHLADNYSLRKHTKFIVMTHVLHQLQLLVELGPGEVGRFLKDLHRKKCYTVLDWDLPQFILDNLPHLDDKSWCYSLAILLAMDSVKITTLERMAAVLTSRKIVISGVSSPHPAGVRSAVKKDECAHGGTASDKAPNAASDRNDRQEMAWSLMTISWFLRQLGLAKGQDFSKLYSAKVITMTFFSDLQAADIQGLEVSILCELTSAIFRLTAPSHLPEVKTAIIKELISVSPSSFSPRSLAGILKTMEVANSEERPCLEPLLGFFDQSSFPAVSPSAALVVVERLHAFRFSLRGLSMMTVKSLVSAKAMEMPLQSLATYYRGLVALLTSPHDVDELKPLAERVAAIESEEAHAMRVEDLCDLLWANLACKRQLPFQGLDALLSDQRVLSCKDLMTLKRCQQLHSYSNAYIGPALQRQTLQHIVETLQDKTATYSLARDAVRCIHRCRHLFSIDVKLSAVTATGEYLPAAFVTDDTGKPVDWPAEVATDCVDARQLTEDLNLQAIVLLPLSDPFYRCGTPGDFSFPGDYSSVTPTSAISVQLTNLEAWGWKVVAFPVQQWASCTSDALLVKMLTAAGVKPENLWKLQHKVPGFSPAHSSSNHFHCHPPNR